MYRFLIIIEKGNENYGAYSPDLPECVAAIKMHLQGMIEDNEPIPTPHTTACYLDVPVSNPAA